MKPCQAPGGEATNSCNNRHAWQKTTLGNAPEITVPELGAHVKGPWPAIQIPVHSSRPLDGAIESDARLLPGAEGWLLNLERSLC